MQTALIVAVLLSTLLGTCATASAGSNVTVPDVSGIQKPLKGGGGGSPVPDSAKAAGGSVVPDQSSRFDRTQTSGTTGATSSDTGNRLDKAHVGSAATTIPPISGTFQGGPNAGQGSTQPCSTETLTIGEDHTKKSSCVNPVSSTIRQ